MPSPIDFYFDFSSPYGYFSSQAIERIASRHGRQVAWRPYLMGAVMKLTGRKPLVHIPLLDDYSKRDLLRGAKCFDIEFSIPSEFPIATIAPCRAFYWLSQQDAEQGKRLAHAIFRAYFVDDRLISDPAVIIEIASDLGVNQDAISEALASQEIKDMLRAATDTAIQRKVFGSPFFLIDDEPFWGHDRLPQIEKWLETGGW